eukprot:TRINITY_DN24042_c0_g1_i2.p1 TRINITY_DN24042_c0_g1~~TRINITY_DN24042_c0_g1_i2.p1  ORF type:complete len:595 (+),score=138.87 TRINITY_DN24042_c0_g1_i2:167-1951(+)
MYGVHSYGTDPSSAYALSACASSNSLGTDGLPSSMATLPPPEICVQRSPQCGRPPPELAVHRSPQRGGGSSPDFGGHRSPQRGGCVVPPPSTSGGTGGFGGSFSKGGGCGGCNATPTRGVGGPRHGGVMSPPRGGVQPGAAPPPRGGGGSASGPGGDSAAKWREAYVELQEEQRQAKADLEKHREEVSSGAAEVQSLREQLERERLETSASMDQYRRRAETLSQENRRLEVKLMKTQMRESAKDTEASDVKREVLDKTAAIEQALRELQQQQQTCSGPPREWAGSPSSSVVGGRGGEPGSGNHDGASGGNFGCSAGNVGGSGGGGGGTVVIGNGRSSGSAGSLPVRRSSATAVLSASDRSSIVDGLGAGGACAGGGSSGSGGGCLAMVPARDVSPQPAKGGSAPSSSTGHSDSDAQRWFQSVKANLEHFGDVEVFIDGTAQECNACCEQMNTSHRIRPRKCRHVYHIECMLQWWTEGTCPVCSVSFAPDQQRPMPVGGGLGGGSPSEASSDPVRKRSPSPGGTAQRMLSRGGAGVYGAGCVRGRGGSGGAPLLSRPAGLPGPGTFGAGDSASGGGGLPQSGPSQNALGPAARSV